MYDDRCHFESVVELCIANVHKISNTCMNVSDDHDLLCFHWPQLMICYILIGLKNEKKEPAA